MSTAAGTVPAREKTALQWHWPEYLCEAGGLAVFMFSACAFTALLEHPMSAIREALDSGFDRRLLMGLAMGATLLLIVFSPLGQRSGAHLNPGVTLNYLMLGKVRRTDAAMYIASQFAGGIAGITAAMLLIGPALSHSAVRYAATVPGPSGIPLAFAAEFAISFLQMLAVLVASNSWRWSRYTPLFAATLVTVWIVLEAPLSGMSMNPARTFASAWEANIWTAWWIYFTAPPLAMLAAGLLYRMRYGIARVYCAKLHHHNHRRCIFRCNFGDM